jgi:hypothetical protein
VVNRFPPTVSLSCLDDTGTCLHYIDLPYYISEFRRLGGPHGIHLSLSKTKVLTSITTGTFPSLPPSDTA